jgi:hypothetical protein
VQVEIFSVLAWNSFHGRPSASLAALGSLRQLLLREAVKGKEAK